MTLLLPGSRFASAESALEPFRPEVDGPFDLHAAAHLLRRSALGSTRAERQRAVDAGPRATVAALLAAPEPAGAYAALLQALHPLESGEDLAGCQALWLARLLHDPAPLREVLALFWHGHFATSVAKVGRPRLLVRQVETLRRQGAGPLLQLLAAVARDPAMIAWLDGNANRRHHPNENFARELFELFTLGRGAYDERDVLDAARAFTGWHEHDGAFRFVPGEHDDGEKQVLGRHGALDGDDVLAACVEHPACARHVAGRLFAACVRPDPEPELVEVLAARYRATGLDTGALLALLLGSRAFHEPRARRALVASPVAFGVGAARCLGLRPDLVALADRLAGLGQSLYAPPGVQGWDGGLAWLNPATLVGRSNLAGELGRLAAARPAAVAEAAGGLDDQALLDALLDGAAPEAAREALAACGDDLAARVQILLTLPEAQLA